MNDFNPRPKAVSPSPDRARPRRSVPILLLAAMTAPAVASLGPYEHGNGIKSMGAGGVSYVAAEETTALSANPAHAAWLGNRYDIGVGVLHFYPEAEMRNNALAPDSLHHSDGRRYYPLPQGGATWQLDPSWSVGVSILLAGVGPDYPNSPYVRFGGAQRASLQLGSSSIASALSYRIDERQSLGVGLVVGYQTLAIEGLQFLGSTVPGQQVSRDPARVTNQGKDGAFSVGWSAGWTGQLSDRVAAGIGYRSKSWTQKHREYRGLLPDAGSLELPAVYGAALSFTPVPALSLALEWQRYAFDRERALGNPLSNLSQGKLLGSPDGPGFGLENQNAWKLGLTWRARTDVHLRAGYVRASQPVQGSDSLFPQLAPVTPTTHYTVGATWIRRDWEWSGYTSYAPRRTVGEDGSIPAAFGGGTATVSNENIGLGFSLGRRFGGTAASPP